MSKITAMYIRLSMEDEDVSLNQKEESNSVSSQRELLEAFIGNHSGLRIRRYRNTVMMDLPEQNLKDQAICSLWRISGLKKYHALL